MKTGLEGGVTDYLVIGFPHKSGSWAAVFPDFVGVTGRGNDLVQAIDEATEGAVDVIKLLMKIDAPLPLPKGLREVQSDHAWANEYGIDWSCAVVTSVVLRAELAREPAPIHPKEHRKIRSARGRAKAGARMPGAPTRIAAGLTSKREARRAEAHV